MAVNDRSVLEQIVAEFDRSSAIEHTTVLGWMQTSEIEAMGALMSLLAEPNHFQRVQPPLLLDEYYDFAADYYERCLVENPDGEWSDSRTTCGWDLAKWFQQLWDDESVPRSLLADLKQRLARLCRKGDLQMCNALVTSVLEHLFQRTEVKDYFSDWVDDQLLSAAFNEARLLAELKNRSRA